MSVTAIRVSVLYVFTTLAVRLMGKRQIGELQPTELVATILISNIAAIPIQDNDLPLVNTITAVLMLVCFEVINTVISMVSLRYRRCVQGSPVIIINNGVIDQKQMRRLRLTVSDLMSALRQKNIFNIEEVLYAVVETDGKISVLQKAQYRPVTLSDMKNTGDEDSIYHTVIVDGKPDKEALTASGYTLQQMISILKNAGTNMKNTFILSINRKGEHTVIRKE